jgi:uncharacterized membrane protein YagU involved in acid resistance
MTTAHAHPGAAATLTHLAYGVAGGLAGGVVFGVLMQAWDMMPMVAQLADSDAVGVGWLLHLAISVCIGAGFAALFATWAARPLPAALIGLAYGLVWWVVGGLLVMPARLGMDVFVLDTTAWRSLAGHLAYGLALGVVYAALARREHP